MVRRTGYLETYTYCFWSVIGLILEQSIQSSHLSNTHHEQHSTNQIEEEKRSYQSLNHQSGKANQRTGRHFRSPNYSRSRPWIGKQSGFSSGRIQGIPFWTGRQNRREWRHSTRTWAGHFGRAERPDLGLEHSIKKAHRIRLRRW